MNRKQELLESAWSCLSDLRTDLFMAFLLEDADVSSFPPDVVADYISRIQGYASGHADDVYRQTHSYLECLSEPEKVLSEVREIA